MHESIIKSRQIKAARTLLDWSQEDLAEAARLSIATIRKLETGSIPRNTTMQFVRHALEKSGLEFVEPGGVRHRPEDVAIYQGPEGIAAFFDDLYQAAKRSGGEIMAVCASEDILLPPSEALIHNERMAALRNRISVKCLLTNHTSHLKGSSYSEYRKISQDAGPIPHIVYGDRCALMLFREETAQKIIVIQSSIVAHAFRQQFEAIWKKAKPLNTKTEKKPKN